MRHFKKNSKEVEPSKTLNSFLIHIDKRIEDVMANRFKIYMVDYGFTYYDLQDMLEGLNFYPWRCLIQEVLNYDIYDIVKSITDPTKKVYEDNFIGYMMNWIIGLDDKDKDKYYKEYVEMNVKKHRCRIAKDSGKVYIKDRHLKNYLVNNYLDEIITPIQSLIRQRQSIIKTIRAFHLTGKPPPI